MKYPALQITIQSYIRVHGFGLLSRSRPFSLPAFYVSIYTQLTYWWFSCTMLFGGKEQMLSESLEDNYSTRWCIFWYACRSKKKSLLVSQA